MDMKNNKKCYARACNHNNIDNTCMYGNADKMKCQVNCYNCERECKKEEGETACGKFRNKNLSCERHRMKEMEIPFELMGRGKFRISVPNDWTEQQVFNYILNIMKPRATLEILDTNVPANVSILDNQINPDIDIAIISETQEYSVKISN